MIQNPILRGFNPDPSICRVGDDYYIAVSTFEWFPGVQIHHSKDLKNWHLVSRPLDTTKLLDMKGNPDSGGVWAPCLTYHDGQFWLIFSDIKVVDGSFKDGANYLTTCETIDGEWSEPIYLNNSGFDPSLFHDVDGKKYVVNMFWDHRPKHHNFAGISIQEYSVSEQKLISRPEIIFKGTELGLTEAPHIYLIGDYYYLLVAEGGTKFEHAASIARSKNLKGPYEVHPHNPLISSWNHPMLPLQKAGHASIVKTQSDEWYLAHLTGRPQRLPYQPITENKGYCTLGRETALQRLYWENDWPYVEGGNFPALEVPAPQLAEHPWPHDFVDVDHFDEPVLNKHFQTLRIPFNEEIGSLTARPGFLRLYGRESLQSVFTQALVARRWQSLEFVAATKVAFQPETFQEFAGLVCYYNTRNWVSCHVTWHEEHGRVINLLACDRFETSAPLGENYIPVPAEVEAVSFKVVAEGATYHFEYSFDGENWQATGPIFETYKLSDDYINQGGFFTGAYVGVHCVDGTGARKAADFDYFSYEETN